MNDEPINHKPMNDEPMTHPGPRHRTPEILLTRTVQIDLIGTGGNGSQMLTALAELDFALRSLGHPGGLNVTAFDPDTVSEANLGRQRFSGEDVGLHKSILLVHRLNAFFGLDWKAVPARYTMPPNRVPDIVVSCVDTAAARREIAAILSSLGKSSLGKSLSRPGTYWLDLGNSVDAGQVVLGLTGALPSVMDLYPHLGDAGIPEDDTPSCSMAEALAKQGLTINRHVVAWAMTLLENLLRFGGLEQHGHVINLADGTANPIPVPADKLPLNQNSNKNTKQRSGYKEAA